MNKILPIFFLIVAFLSCREDLTPAEKLRTRACVNNFLQEVLERGTEVRTPNVFTPDGDGINDVFFVAMQSDTGSFSNYQLTIINTVNNIGETIFRTEDMQESWDGNLESGEAVPDGFYTFIVRVDFGGTTYLLTGDFALIRPNQNSYALESCENCLFPDQIDFVNGSVPTQQDLRNICP